MIQEFIAHLDANITPSVQFAWTSNPVEEMDDDLPIVFVAPGDYNAELSQFDNVVRQQVNENLVVMLGCPVDDYEALRAEIRAAALGWTFQAYDAVELIAGETLGITGGVIWIQETYLTRYLITEG